MHNYDSVLPEMLADGVRVLIYAGELDLICNWLGNERWVDALEWEQAGAWRQVTPKPWLVGSDGGASGEARQLGPLTFLKVYKAGHMVPMDQPRAALDMITRFTRAIPFAEGGSLAQAVRGGAAAGSSQTRAAVRNKIVQIGAHGATGKAAPDALMAQR